MMLARILKIAAIALLVLVGALAIALLVLAGRGGRKLVAPDTPFPTDIMASSDPVVIDQGRYLVHTVAHCSQCHGAYERAHPEKNVDGIALSGGFDFSMPGVATSWGANLTPDPETGIGRRTDAELARTITAGVLHDGSLSLMMRYSASNLSREDVIAILSYLRSQEPVKHDVGRGEATTIGKAMLALFDIGPDLSPLPEHVPHADAPTVERGRYLAEHVALCVACHSDVDMQTFMPKGPKGAGSPADPSPGEDTDKEFAAPNLTSHATGMTGRLDEDQFVQRIRRGRVFTSSKMPWENFSRMSEADLRSIYRYLRSLPPVENDVGPTYRDRGWRKE